MKILRILRNYLCYCGIEKEEYNAIKRDAYVSNFRVWRLLHLLMSASFGVLFVASLFAPLLKPNLYFNLAAFLYSAIASALFWFVLKKDSFLGQLMIYLSISLLLLFGCLITVNKPSITSVTFLVILLISGLFMIDKPYYMSLEMCLAVVVFLVWTYFTKDHDIWQIDLGNTLAFLPVGIVIHVISNSVRIKEFVLTREINIQKDKDELTGLLNKSALTREINAVIRDPSATKGLMMLLDIDLFKGINDTYGHDVGDIVLADLGRLLSSMFVHGEIVGRFGGDEFIVFLKGLDDREKAKEIAREIVFAAAKSLAYPGQKEPISVSVGIAIYHGSLSSYSEIFKKADIAMYQAKAGQSEHISLFAEEAVSF
ncbi:MAG: GGDEF domain-containing protein [Bacilli bacterium]|nr:GGDEF domain-containing protein [Bacilli bacterium]